MIDKEYCIAEHKAYENLNKKRLHTMWGRSRI